ncbi:hypothetical protein K493DRAFT_336838 [Basidiobolus meristosporus CBS 931.73]|uniref:Uncharacterized protein n=1 Tax=Basidiobolus meristosporus CBS 931.73 TaxID=1314790 RepID=A0A1Y1YF10_9FUNG|nr:hypothetical protein K493DRAFT_336838 [Basidiobolus meristosporus CBS 931.73]|eukprot:ORX96620.1 hypothetical protein K493DRAFT_336838 [Basidiobolus meristosporus CBS 931.73]
MDLNWCIICDKHVDAEGDLYCSQDCKANDNTNLAFDMSNFELHPTPGSLKARRPSTVSLCIPLPYTKHEHSSAASSLSSTHSHLAITPPDHTVRGEGYFGNAKVTEAPFFRRTFY